MLWEWRNWPTLNGPIPLTRRRKGWQRWSGGRAGSMNRRRWRPLRHGCSS